MTVDRQCETGFGFTRTLLLLCLVHILRRSAARSDKSTFDCSVVARTSESTPNVNYIYFIDFGTECVSCMSE